MSQLIYNSRSDLIADLEARRPWAEKYDRECLARNERARREWWDENKRRMRVALKWSLDEAESHDYAPTFRRSGRSWPKVDTPVAVQCLDHQLAVLTLTQQETFKITEDGAWSTVFWLLTEAG